MRNPSMLERLTGRTELEHAHDRIAALKHKLAMMRGEKDSDVGDNEIVEETTRPNEREPAKRDVGDENEKSDEELDAEAERIAREIERRRKLKQKKGGEPEDTSSSPSERLDPRDPEGRHGNAAYWAKIDAATKFVISAHERANKSERASAREPVQLVAPQPADEPMSYEEQVAASVAFIAAADKRRREG